VFTNKSSELGIQGEKDILYVLQLLDFVHIIAILMRQNHIGMDNLPGVGGTSGTGSMANKSPLASYTRQPCCVVDANQVGTKFARSYSICPTVHLIVLSHLLAENGIDVIVATDGNLHPQTKRASVK